LKVVLPDPVARLTSGRLDETIRPFVFARQFCNKLSNWVAATSIVEL
jgi:hypothetical protein